MDQPKWVRRSDPNHEMMNKLIYDLMYRAKLVSNAYPILTAEEVRDYLRLPSDESKEDLIRKAKTVEVLRRSASNTPVVLRHYQGLVQRMEHMQRELNEVKAQLKSLKNDK
jgi:hypothetical protein